MLIRGANWCFCLVQVQEGMPVAREFRGHVYAYGDLPYDLRSYSDENLNPVRIVGGMKPLCSISTRANTFEVVPPGVWTNEESATYRALFENRIDESNLHLIRSFHHSLRSSGLVSIQAKDNRDSL